MMKGIIHSEKSGIAGMKYRDLQEMHPQRGEIQNKKIPSANWGLFYIIKRLFK
ncbi:hypothetical protein [Priestia megaterium]|uniref:hypothetical protein n=2 Tax=Priestia megaterium TaxID=1404 RepID=UPI001596FF84|nr:hypothetical protein [Priestia megaterium]MDH2454428.1 hypothetical protein [Priestia megaterium]MDL5153884.1 hypothetical protein [Priestia megaterium]MED3871399.1 hypothetical protein [Priestia megaterium]